jgi:hypothetical protein
VREIRGCHAFFSIHADNLLLAGNDPGLDDGGDFGGLDETVDGDTIMCEKGSQPRSRRVAANQAADLDAVAKRPKITRNVGGTAGITGLTLHFDDRHGSFRGDAGDLAPDEFIQHDIPDYQQPLLPCAIKKVLYSFNFHLMMRALLPGLRPFAKPKIPMLSRLLFAFVCGLAFASSLAQLPPTSIDLSKFPAAAVDEVVVPVPSEIFSVLDKLGSPNWKAEMRDNLGKNTGNRAQVALLLGTVIADGFIAVEAENSESVKKIGQEVLNLADAINVRKAVIARSKSIIDKADAKNWRAVREELDGALQDVRSAMVELGDADLAQLVSIGGWIRGTEVLTSIVGKNYSASGAELLNQPELVIFFSRRIDEMRNSRLKKEDLVVRVRKLLRDIRPLIGKSGIPQASVEKINKMTNEIVVIIASEEPASP